MTGFIDALHSPPALHVFEQEGGWHWGITIARQAGSGFRLVAYSETTFTEQHEAQSDGTRALREYAHADGALAS